MAYVTGCTYAVLTNQSAAMAYVTGHTYAVLTNQSTGIAYVTACTYAFRPIRARYSNEGAPPQYVCAPLARPLRPPRPPCAPHGVYVTEDTYAVLTNQSTGIAYVTACTYAFRPIRARYSNEGAPPQYVCAPLARPLRPPRPPLRPSRGVRHGGYVRCFNQSEHGYSVRHGVYVRFSTNQSTIF